MIQQTDTSLFGYSADGLIRMIKEAPNFTEEVRPIEYSGICPVRSNRQIGLRSRIR